MDWTPCTLLDGYIINDKKLWDGDRRILVTYKTRSEKLMVTQVWSERGKIMTNKVNGEIIAWSELPKPYNPDEWAELRRRAKE